MGESHARETPAYHKNTEIITMVLFFRNNHVGKREENYVPESKSQS